MDSDDQPASPGVGDARTPAAQAKEGAHLNLDERAELARDRSTAARAIPGHPFLYSVYGLTVASELELPELTAGAGEPGIRIVAEAAHSGEDEVGGGPRFKGDGRSAELSYPRVATLVVREGREVVVRPVTGADVAAIRALVLGPAFGVLLHQRGVLALHASSVMLAGGVVGFMGGSGWGKSTLAASLQRRGHELVADDITAVDTSETAISALPGFPQLKLLPEAAEALGLDPGTLPRVSADDEKRARRVAAALPPGRLPVAALYVLAEGDAPRIEALSTREALLELVRHSFCAPRLAELGVRDHFLQCADVARSVPVRRLRRPRVLALLDAVAELIEADARRAP